MKGIKIGLPHRATDEIIYKCTKINPLFAESVLLCLLVGAKRQSGAHFAHKCMKSEYDQN